MLDRVSTKVEVSCFFCREEGPGSKYTKQKRAAIPAVKAVRTEAYPTILTNLVPQLVHRWTGLAAPIGAILICENVAPLD